MEEDKNEGARQKAGDDVARLGVEGIQARQDAEQPDPLTTAEIDRIRQFTAENEALKAAARQTENDAIVNMRLKRAGADS